jgi:hypothetical protein
VQIYTNIPSTSIQGVVLNYKKGYICVMVLPLSCLGWHVNTIVNTLTISITFTLLTEMATQKALILCSIKDNFQKRC